jgi:hypothetical protein
MKGALSPKGMAKTAWSSPDTRRFGGCLFLLGGATRYGSTQGFRAAGLPDGWQAEGRKFFVAVKSSSDKVSSCFVCSDSQNLILSIWYFRKGPQAGVPVPQLQKTSQARASLPNQARTGLNWGPVCGPQGFFNY